MNRQSADQSMSSARTLTIIWVLISAAVAYPLYNFLFSLGLNNVLAGIAVFVGICLMYDIPYRARVKAEHQIATARAQQWQNRTC